MRQRGAAISRCACATHREPLANKDKRANAENGEDNLADGYNCKPSKVHRRSRFQEVVIRREEIIDHVRPEDCRARNKTA